jgi:hypothetical protein
MGRTYIRMHDINRVLQSWMHESLHRSHLAQFDVDKVRMSQEPSDQLWA